MSEVASALQSDAQSKFDHEENGRRKLSKVEGIFRSNTEYLFVTVAFVGADDT